MSRRDCVANWIDRHTVTDLAQVANLQLHLHGGERKVVVLAAELQANLVIGDESAARRELARCGLRFNGTVGVLMEVKQRGLIRSLKPELDHLRLCGSD